jgi:hypothetical protein
MILAGDSPKGVPRMVSPENRSVRASGTQARFRDVRTAEGPASSSRTRGRLGLIATIRQEMLGVPRASALDVAPKTRFSWYTRAFSRPGDSRASSARSAADRPPQPTTISRASVRRHRSIEHAICARRLDRRMSQA